MKIVQVMTDGPKGRWGTRKWKSRAEIFKHKQRLLEEAKAISAKRSSPVEVDAHTLGLYDFDASLQHTKDWEDAWTFVMGRL